MGPWAPWAESPHPPIPGCVPERTQRPRRQTNPMGPWGVWAEESGWLGSGLREHGGSARSPNEVRCLTDQEILIADERGSEAPDLWVNGLPEGETPTGHEHAA